MNKGKRGICLNLPLVQVSTFYFSSLEGARNGAKPCTEGSSKPQTVPDP